MKYRDIPNTNEIGMYFHCGKCLQERPDDQSPRDWQRIQVGMTKQGLQVWCVRHECNVIHVDFEGRKHPANQTAAKNGDELMH
jgi:hypothetical protein